MKASEPATKDDVKKLDRRVKNVEVRLEKAEGRLDKIEGRLDKIEGRLDKIEGRLDKIDHDMSELKRDVKRLEILQEHMDTKLDTIIEILAPNIEDTTVVKERLDNHEYRIDTLEKFQRATL